MQSILPIAILCGLGVAAGWACHRKWPQHFWKACNVAALIATSAWVAGCYILFALTAPSELGALHPGALFAIVLISWFAAAFSGWVNRLRTHAEN